MESQEDSVERYEAAVEKIKEMTGEDNLDLDVPRFIEVEDRNFALFNYVNEMNNEIELLHDQMRQVSRFWFGVYFYKFCIALILILIHDCSLNISICSDFL